MPERLHCTPMQWTRHNLDWSTILQYDMYLGKCNPLLRSIQMNTIDRAPLETSRRNARLRPSVRSVPKKRVLRGGLLVLGKADCLGTNPPTKQAGVVFPTRGLMRGYPTSSELVGQLQQEVVKIVVHSSHFVCIVIYYRVFFFVVIVSESKKIRILRSSLLPTT